MANKALLTPRELQILSYLLLSNQEIAQKLYIERCTVRTHITSIRQKLCASSKAECIINAMNLGLLDITDIKNINRGQHAVR